MGFKDVLFAATLASSQIASGSDAPAVRDAQHDISQKAHGALSHDGHQKHPHVQVSAGFEHNHLLDHGQLLEGDFSSVGIHGSLGNWWAYYHWLQAEESPLEHKGGITYSHALNKRINITAGLSGVYEVTWSEHGHNPHPTAPEDPSSSESHKYAPQETAESHETAEKDEPVLESTLYAAISTQLEATLHQNETSKTTLTLWGEYDLGALDTFFVHAGVKHVQDISGVQVQIGAKVIDVLATDSSHVKEWVLGVWEVGVAIPLWASKKWSLGFGWQVTTRGDKTAKIGLSRTF